MPQCPIAGDANAREPDWPLLAAAPATNVWWSLVSRGMQVTEVSIGDRRSAACTRLGMLDSQWQRAIPTTVASGLHSETMPRLKIVLYVHFQDNSLGRRCKVLKLKMPPFQRRGE